MMEEFSLTHLLIIVFVFTIYALTAKGIASVFRISNIPWQLAWVPVVNYIFLLSAAGLSKWLAVGFWIPLVNFGVFGIMFYKLANRLNLGLGYALGFFFFPYIFFPIVGTSINKGKVQLIQ
jgi:hypothetical protein